MARGVKKEDAAADDSAARVHMRIAICDAALAIIKKNGLSAVSMRAIAQRLGVSAMMPYNYYDGKDELLLDLRLRQLLLFSQYLKGRLSADGPVERLRGVCRGYLIYSRTHPEEYRLMFEAWSFDDLRGLRQKYAATQFRSDELWSVLRDCVTDCIADRPDETRDASGDLLTHLVWSQLHGLASLHLAQKLVFGLTVDDLETAVLDAVTTIVRPPS